MARELFKPKEFTHAHSRVIRQANEIISDYRKRGFVLTLRQLYYQFVARDLIPNTLQSYKRLGDILNDARLAGRVDWDMIEDRTRNLESPSAWADPQSIMSAVADQFRLNPWENQRVRFEVWPEKEALTGVIEPVCTRLRIPFFACRGYVSQSEAYRAGKRLGAYARTPGVERVIVLHLGDHDPSGLQMTEDNAERLRMFSGTRKVELRRIALTYDQIEEYKPPENPAKTTDSRIGGYRRIMAPWALENGYIDPEDPDIVYPSWELDALDPDVIDALIAGHVEPEIDQAEWDKTIAEENRHRDLLKGVSDYWSRIEERPWMQRRPAEVRDEAVGIAEDHGAEIVASEILGIPLEVDDA